MDQLGDVLRIGGRAAVPVTADVVRQLTAADLALLDQPRPTGQTPSIARISQRHHQLARALASGMKPAECAQRVGYSLSRVSILQADPAFADLVSHYQGMADAAFGDLQEKLSGLAHVAVEVLADRLEETPETFSNDTLIDIGKFAADRSGHGPTSKTQVDVNVNLADRLAAARKKLQGGDNAKDVTPPLLEGTRASTGD